MNKIIAVDGPAGSGKSSIAKLLAQRINFTYFDTGSVYRAITYFFQKEGVSVKDEAKIAEKLNSLNLDFKADEIFLNSENVDEFLKTDDISKEVASFSKIDVIRRYVRFIQKRFAAENNCVMDGRDIGSVVFPNAFCKFYLDADVEERSKRRFEELQKKGNSKSLEDIKREIILRDHLDRSRKKSPLKINPDAHVIDSSHLSLDEVLEEMINHYNQQLELSGSSSDNNNLTFLKALESYNQEKSGAKRRKILKGVVISIKDDEITLDVGEKTDAYIEKEEGRQLIKDFDIKIDDELEVVFLEKSSKGVNVSKLIADKNRSSILIEKAFENSELIQGKVDRVIRGGFIININGNLAFCPYSEFDLKNVNSEQQIGKTFDFSIIENNNGKLIVSRKKILTEIYKKNKETFFNEVYENSIISGKVVSFLRMGALLEVKEGVTFLLKNEDISWKYVKNANQVLEKGDIIDVKVLECDKANERLVISKKELEVDPLITFSEVHRPGDIVKGTIRRIENFGAFVSLEDGLDGLLHVSNLSWFKKVEHPKQVVKKNEEVEVKILSIDVERRKLSLGLREVSANPWDTMDQTYPINHVVLGEISLVIKTGIYLLIDDKIEGFIDIRDTRYVNEKDFDLKEKFQEGDEVFGTVKRIYKSKRRLELILKEKSDDPWKDFEYTLKKDSVFRGKIKEIFKNGVNVEIYDNIVGFCHKSQISDKDVAEINIADEVKEGEEYSFYVQSFNAEKKDLKLSRREYLERQNKKREFKQYSKGGDKTEKVTLSDFFSKDD